MADPSLPALVDTSLSHLAPSLAGRLRTPQARQVALWLGSLPLRGAEGMGPTLFRACLQDLQEDPWDRLSSLASALDSLPLRLALRGQALVGERLYPDDVVRAFVRHAVQRGVRAFRLYDWLNDPSNLAVPVEAVRREGAEAFVGLCYWPEEGEAPEEWARRARALARLGASALVLQDPAGLLTPEAVRRLVPALREAAGLPLYLHLHNAVDTALAVLRAGLEAGAQGAEGSLLPLGGRRGTPSLLALLRTLAPEGPGLLGEGVRQAPRLLDGLPGSPQEEAPDLAMLVWGVPERLVGRIRAHLREVGMEERLEDALAEVHRTRRELGAPPLLGPVGDLVALQAVQNVLFGRWRVVPTRVREFVAGYYGRPPHPVDPEVRRRALEELGRPPVPEGARPADLLEPGVDAAERSARGLARGLGDVLLCALFPDEGLRFLRVREGQEPLPQEEETPAPSPRARTYRVFVEGRPYRVVVDPLPPRPPAPRPAEARRARPSPPAGLAEVPLTAPMPGVLLRFVVEVGQRVREGETVAYLDAMKMENALPSPATGVVVELRGKPGERVQRGAVLAIIRREG